MAWTTKLRESSSFPPFFLNWGGGGVKSPAGGGASQPGAGIVVGDGRQDAGGALALLRESCKGDVKTRTAVATAWGSQ